MEILNDVDFKSVEVSNMRIKNYLTLPTLTANDAAVLGYKDGDIYVWNGSSWGLVGGNFAARKYVGTITGNGSKTLFAVTHNFGTRSIVVSVYDQTGETQVDTTVDMYNQNTIYITFSSPPPNGRKYDVTVIG